MGCETERARKMGTNWGRILSDFTVYISYSLILKIIKQCRHRFKRPRKWKRKQSRRIKIISRYWDSAHISLMICWRQLRWNWSRSQKFVDLFFVNEYKGSFSDITSNRSTWANGKRTVEATKSQKKIEKSITV